MIVAAAVDVRQGRCVQLVGGDPDVERVSLPSPVEAARSWLRAGFTTLHVVDLDAALGSGTNSAVVERLAQEDARVRVGGGVRTQERARALDLAGADEIVVGTRALSDPEWLAALAHALPGRIVAAADVRGTEVVVKGWTESSRRSLGDVLADWSTLPLGGVLMTDVSREGSLSGLDGALVERARATTAHRLHVAGGIGGIEDLRTAERAGADGVVLGMALYTGAFDLPELFEEFPQTDRGEGA